MIDKIKEYAKVNNVPVMKDDGLNFLLAYIKENHIKNILEIGSAIGYSAIMMANLSDDIQIDTIEIDTTRYLEALKNIKIVNLTDRIRVHHADALSFITEKKYDLIFIDAAKAQYKKYMEHYLNNLKENGVFVFDNLNFHGMVDDFSLTKNRNTKSLIKKIKAFRDEMLMSEKYNVSFYKEIGDGVMLVGLKNNV